MTAKQSITPRQNRRGQLRKTKAMRAMQTELGEVYEHDSQVAVIRWTKLAIGALPDLAMLYAIPNGGDRHPVVAAKLKAEGVKAGVPDLELPVARYCETERRLYFGLYIEMKKLPGPDGKKNYPSREQRAWHTALREQGYRVEVCYGFEDARMVLLEYLTLTPALEFLRAEHGLNVAA